MNLHCPGILVPTAETPDPHVKAMKSRDSQRLFHLGDVELDVGLQFEILVVCRLNLALNVLLEIHHLDKILVCESCLSID